MKNRILSVALALCLCLGLAVPAWAAGPTFTDVPASHWAYDAIEDMSSRGVVAGFGNGRFGPGVNVTTAQFSVMLARLFYNDEMSQMPADEAWFRNAITLLAGKGVLDNTSAALKNYDANSVSAPMNRYDMAQTMYGLLKAEGVTMLSGSELQATAQRIADFNTIPAQYTDAVKNMYDLGCLAGVDAAGNFKGENTMNRAQACVVLARLEKTIADREAGEVPAKPSDPAEQEPPTETADPGTTSTELGQKLPSGATAAAGVKSSIGKDDAYPTYGPSDVVSSNGYYSGATDVDIGDAVLVYELLDMVNAARAEEGSPALKWTTFDQAEEYTLLRAHELASNFSHDRPNGSYNILGEVCTKGPTSSVVAYNNWMNSPAHKEILMDPGHEYMIAAKSGNRWIICLGIDADDLTLNAYALGNYTDPVW